MARLFAVLAALAAATFVAAAPAAVESEVLDSTTTTSGGGSGGGGGTCGGNCPSGDCTDCPCGTTPNQVDIASACSSYSGWDQSCCQCIACVFPFALAAISPHWDQDSL